MEGPKGSFVDYSRIGWTAPHHVSCLQKSWPREERIMPIQTVPYLGFATIMQDYGVTLQYYRAPYLVDIDMMEGKRVLRLEDISENSQAWRSADVLSFNTGHWWSHTGGLQG